MKKINTNFLTKLFAITSIFILSFGFILQFSSSFNNKELIHDDQYTTSVIGETEILTIDIDGVENSGDEWVIERDIIDFNPYKDYGTAELDAMWGSLDSASNSAKGYITLLLETSKYYEYGEEIVLDFDEMAGNDGTIEYSDVMDDASIPPNVKRVIYVMDEPAWEYLFTKRNSAYTYEGFLTAVAKYPRFCGERALKVPGNDKPITESKSLEEVCAMELSFMFGHFAQETNFDPSLPADEAFLTSLFFLEELHYDDTSTCGYYQCDDDWGDAFPCYEENGTSYHGRGAKQLSYNYNYGPYSRVAYGTDDQETILSDPKIVKQEEHNLTSAMYFYMSPRGQKPSIHWVATGIWYPTEAELDNNLLYGFGITTNIINGGIECGPTPGNPTGADQREAFFEEFAKYFNVWTGYGAEFDENNCKEMTPFGSGVVPGVPVQPYSWGYNGSTGMLLTYEATTAYTFLFPGDYYRTMQAGAKAGIAWGPASSWEDGLTATWTPVGTAYMEDVVHNENTGWVSSEPSSDASTKPAASIVDPEITNIDNDSLTGEITFETTVSQNKAEDLIINAVLYDATGDQKNSIEISDINGGVNTITFSGLSKGKYSIELNAEYTLDASSQDETLDSYGFEIKDNSKPSIPPTVIVFTSEITSSENPEIDSGKKEVYVSLMVNDPDATIKGDEVYVKLTDDSGETVNGGESQTYNLLSELTLTFIIDEEQDYNFVVSANVIVNGQITKIIL